MIFVSMLYAAPPVDAPRLLRFEAPAAEALRLTLPADVVGADPDRLPRALELQDAAGNPVPFAIATSRRGDAATVFPVVVVPTGEGAWRTAELDRPVDRLRLDLQDWGVGVAEVRIDGGPPQLIWRVDRDSGRVEWRELELPPGIGPFALQLRRLDGQPARIREVEGVAAAPEAVPARVERLPLEAPVRTEEGRDRYPLQLPGPRAVTALRFSVAERLFDREVQVSLPRGDDLPSPEVQGRITRLELAGARIDRPVVPTGLLRGDRLLVDVATDVGRGLGIDAVEVESLGAELLLSGVPGGSYSLYVGGDHEPSTDLGQARVDLLRIAQPLDLSAARLEPNPAWLPRPTAEGVDDASTALQLRRWRFLRPLTGPAGWVEVELDRTVLAHARNDLGDLRVVDAGDRQIPFVVVDTGGETPWETSPFERSESGTRTRLRVDLGSDAAPVATVRLRTDKEVFRREVTVLVDHGTVTSAIRRVSWEGTVSGGLLALSVDQVVGRQLLLEIENGDNPPLRIEAVEVTAPRKALRVKLPPEGARLLYGAPDQTHPSYDLGLLTEDILRLPVGVAGLGPEAAVEPPALAGLDKLVVVGAIGVLALGLVGLLVRVLRGATGPAGEPAAGSAGPEPEAEPPAR